MHNVPSVILEDPDSYFSRQWNPDSIKYFPGHTVATFNQLCSSTDYSLDKLERRKFFLLHDYGHCKTKLDDLDSRKIGALMDYRMNPGIEAARRRAHALGLISTERKKVMATFEHVVSLLILICHHLVTVRAGSVNPTDEVQSD